MRLFDAYWSAGRIDDAFALYRDALTDCEQTYGPDAPDSITLRAHLAWAYLEAQRPEGVPLLERNITALERTDCPHPTLAFRRSELGIVHTWVGRASDAIHVLEQGLDEIADLDDKTARRVKDDADPPPRQRRQPAERTALMTD